jgi:hypothetical protein
LLLLEKSKEDVIGWQSCFKTAFFEVPKVIKVGCIKDQDGQEHEIHRVLDVAQLKARVDQKIFAIVGFVAGAHGVFSLI